MTDVQKKTGVNSPNGILIVIPSGLFSHIRHNLIQLGMKGDERMIRTIHWGCVYRDNASTNVPFKTYMERQFKLGVSGSACILISITYLSVEHVQRTCDMKFQ